MACHPPSSGGVLCHDETWNNGPRCPSELAGDPPREPDLDVDGPKQSLEIGDDRLDFDYQNGVSRRVPRQQIDAAPLSVAAEGDLHPNDPAGGLEELREGRLKSRMARIQEPIQLAASPPTVHLKVDVERLADAAKRADGEAGRPLPLQLGDHTPTDTSATGEIDLAPSQAKPNGTHDLSERPIHVGIVRAGPLPPAYGRLIVRWHHQCR